ncbi:MAG: LPS translocon maturation chaperone LptM [Sodalis sp. (in: enterobacteria)]
MRKIKSKLRRAASGFMLLGIYGCGLKGSLYFPPTENADKSEQKHQLTTTQPTIQSPA